MHKIDLNSVVAKNIRLSRQQRRLSQEGLAALCGLHRTYIGAIEREERNITLKTLEQIALALGINPVNLLQQSQQLEQAANIPRTSFISAIKASGISIYDSLEKSPELYVDTTTLEFVLNQGLLGFNLNYPIRSRSKILKAKVCELLGYPVPLSFKKTKPRFPGQNFDTYVQKSNTLQIWNEEVDPFRRYILIRVNKIGRVIGVRIVSGDVIAKLDKTGTLTQKYQAKSLAPITASVLISDLDTKNIIRRIIKRMPTGERFLKSDMYAMQRDLSKFIPIEKLFKRLSRLLGSIIPDPGIDQERNRGAGLHEIVCKKIFKIPFANSGQVPDVPSQLLELKLQTSPTIDLGVVSPDSVTHLNTLPAIRHCDMRYAIFYGVNTKAGVRLDYLILTTGEVFFTFFKKFGGKVKNEKLQIPLPRNFFGQPK
ncbi:helix-turn-helix domain-containing protein [Planctomycetota bacterium]